jgi:dipeptidyl aminopeptidase/acylaminoacyl peptidase
MLFKLPKMKSNLFAVIVFFSFFNYTYSQEKKSLSHNDYGKWENLNSADLHNDGTRVLYVLNPQREDGQLIIHDMILKTDVVVPRGVSPAFSPGGGYAVFLIEPPREVLKQARSSRRKSESVPKDSLGIYLFAADTIIKMDDVQSYQLPKSQSDWLTFSRTVKKEVEETTPEPVAISLLDSVPMAETQTIEPIRPIKTENISQLVIHNPLLAISHAFDDVESYTISDNGRSILFVEEYKQANNRNSTRKLYVFDTYNQTTTLLDSTQGGFKHVIVSANGEYFAWLQTGDTSRNKNYDLYVQQIDYPAMSRKINGNTASMPAGFGVSEHKSLQFSQDNSRLFFGIGQLPREEPKDSLPDDERVSVDVWHWQDAMLQSQQRINMGRKKEENFETVLHIPTGRIVPLTDAQVPAITKDRRGIASKFMGSSELPYLRESSWTGHNARDIYVIDANTGKKTKILERAESNVILSLNGNFILYYNPVAKAWFTYNTNNGEVQNLTREVGVPFYDVENDEPRHARPYGIAGWGINDSFVLIYDQYDIWRLDPTGKERPVNITQGYGRRNLTSFRYQNLDAEEVHIPTGEIWLGAFHTRNKKSGYYKIDLNGELQQVTMQDAHFSGLQKARDKNVLVWRRSTFKDFPDLWTSKMDFSEERKVSSANAFQEEYLWGSVSLVEWRDFNNKSLQGLLYLPEDFDPRKKYPMIVYFYEKTSNTMHRHTIPTPSRSTINAPYCTSNGYIVFMPDITYETGFPGHSAYNAVVSGTHAMIERYPFIDRERIGLQGQSWGGYQITYLITRTNMFRAAMAGAPVSNMISAYGGIRWESGAVRQFQYEQTQSRIGGTPWDKPFHYIENSPVFYVRDIQTPLLIMANDNDGAVPWSQSIELFTAMRRLDKPVWMLVYNREAHNLREWPARMDLSVRMYQFFDYYLKDKPAPRWLRDGIPYDQKGTNRGYDLVE